MQDVAGATAGQIRYQLFDNLRVQVKVVSSRVAGPLELVDQAGNFLVQSGPVEHQVRLEDRLISTEQRIRHATWPVSHQ